MTSKFIWQIGEDWSITKVSKGNNKLFADAKATPVYAVIGNSQMLETDTVEMTCTINGNSYHKVLLHYAETSNHIILDNESVAGWEVVSNGEELQTETSTYDVMTISFDIKRFSTIDGTTLLKNQPTGQTTENVYASDSYTPMVESSDAEHLEDLIAELNSVKQDKYDTSLETDSKYVVGAINELLGKIQDIDLYEITSQTVRITDLSTGIYKWTMTGQCSIYYNGQNGNETIIRNLFSTNNSEYIFVNKYQSLGRSNWSWYLISADLLGSVKLLGGYTSLTSGVYKEYDLSEIKTSIENIIAELDNKQDKLTFDEVPVENSSNPVKSGGLYNEFQNVREQAEGKTASYTISYATTGNEPFNSQNDNIALSSSGSIEDVEGNIIALSDLKKGDIIWIAETEVPDRWVASIASNVVSFYKMETTKTDISSKVDKTNQAYKLYATDSLGHQTTVSYDTYVEGAIARRDEDGQITVPLTPDANGHSASKKYVDDGLATKQDALPSHTSADVNKVLTVDSNNDVVWDYPADEFVMFTKTNNAGTFAVTGAEWVSAMNNDKAILQVTDGTDYYVLYKVKYDAATVYFQGDGKEAQFIKDGVNYEGTFASLALTNAEIDTIMDAILV